jgi:uncharacterized Fe-S center protein
MSKVYLLKDISKISEQSEKLLSKVFPDDSTVTIKLHFGEPGNVNAFTPKDLKPIVEVLIKHDIKVKLLDTPVAYNSPRNTVEGYTKVAKDRGYEDLGEIVISDNYRDVEMKDFTAPVSTDLVDADNVLVISHVKGHSCAGFGGAIKNLGMGGLSREGKGLIHGLCKPKFVKDCEGCGTCAKLCPAGAIEMVDGKAVIALEKCWGCSICEIHCPYGCLAPQKATFDDLLAQGACACINNFPKSTYYINFIIRVSENCDCESDKGKDIAKDVGVLFSDNPVAIDKASIDLVEKAEGDNVFKKVHHKDPNLQVDYAAQYCDFGMDYELVEL